MASGGRENEACWQSTDIESEIRSLREQLRASQSNASTSSQHNETNWPGPAPAATPGTVFNTLNQSDAGLNFSPVRQDSPPVSTDFPHATLGSSVTNDADLQCLTTRPGLDPPTHHRASLFPLARPRALGNVSLQIEEIDELFNMYIKYNNPYLPLIDEKKSPHEYYERSDLLFWVIMAVAARRHKSQPTLLPRMARNVTELLWKTLRSMSYSISTIPAPSVPRMGLHCAFDAQDFAKVPLQLDVSEHSEWAQTWEACNIVAISIRIFSSSCQDIEAWYLMAARLHLQAFYLFDHPAVEGYKTRIVALFSTAYNLVDLSQRLNEQPQGLFDYCPFFCYQAYVNGAFVLLKILTNGFFNTIIDAKAGKQLLESSITGLRQMSVVNNDLPARLGDIIGFFCALPDPATRTIHRNIKCANILVAEAGGVQLCDFGVGGFMETKFDKRSTVTGSLHWMAPELFNPTFKYGTEVDNWIGGCFWIDNQC
ncbi:zn 2cys6 transcriptional activator [Fusarium acutatum]|uniref:Zn 2cys6 transcriptional activator n=1 Tax=Fusarium acutatum TaxID=78861 RepID=A0A8H4JJG4_9HYPO|nr:zn 2cys6 transcriptional activator [Fusarium acutatum]